MAMLRKVKAVMSTLLEISSIQEMPDAKKYLIMTLTEMIISWNARKMQARMALMKWRTLKILLIFTRSEFLLCDVYYPKRTDCQVLYKK
jgi:hypothetical protein